MDNLDDSENNAKISDSAYSNSCSNSQSRRSHSSKSTHSGSNSSGSSGYGGKPSTSGSSNKLEQTKKDKDSKKKKQSQSEVKVIEEPVVVECKPPEPAPVPSEHEEEINDVVEPPLPPLLALPEKAADSSIDVMTLEQTPNNDEVQIVSAQAGTSVSFESTCQVANLDSDGFSCAISMHDGVVMYTTKNLTANLGFPKDMWIGRSFIDFVHPKDRSTFASQITNGLAVPKNEVDFPEKVQSPGITDCTMVCRIRRYRSLEVGFGVKDRTVSYMPFLLKFLFKDIKDDDGKIIYLIIQATPFHSAYKIPNECVVNATPFVIRHSAAGILEYIDIGSVPYLGYLPQDIHNKDALLLYHPEDLPYLKMIYETIVKEGSVAKSMPYRMLTFNGDYVKLETEWSSFINPWSMKLEFVIGKHYIVEGPTIPDVFLSPPVTKSVKITDDQKIKNQQAEAYRESILKVLKEVLTKPAEKAKQQMDKRCQDLAMIMESLLEEQPKPEEELKVVIPEPEPNCFLRSSVRQERDSVMLGGISPHHDYDSKSSLGTPPSYNQLNYNENLQRYFDSHENYTFEENNAVGDNFIPQKDLKPNSSCISPLVHQSGDSYEMDSSSSSAAMLFNSFSPPAPMPEFHPPRLTESVLSKHNSEMERELAKIHRESRVISKGEKVSDNRQKKKEHLARCNATYQPTAQPHGLKRTLKPMEPEIAHKHQRQSRKRQSVSTMPTAIALPITTTSVAATHTMWPKHTNATSINSINPYAISAGITQQMPMMSHLQGVLPMYYTPTVVPTASHLPSTPSVSNQHTHQQQQEMMSQHFPQPQMAQLPQPQIPQGQLPVQHYPSATMPWMYPQPVYGSPYIYPQMPYSVQQQQAMMAQSMAYNQAPCQSLHPLGLANNNYIQSTEPVPVEPSRIAKCPMKKPNYGQISQNSDETMDRTDGESSYSSFYSSFFKTESGSAEDSSDPKKSRNDLITKYWTNKERRDETTFQAAAPNNYTYEPQPPKKTPRRKMDPPWMEQVCVTSDLVYKYQIQPKSKEEVLQADKEKMKKLEQPALVNEQLGQLYMDLQLEGVTSRLTLEEGITSSSSSGEETCSTTRKPKLNRRKREYSKLNMIYEEDAPLPPPNDFGNSELKKPELEAISLSLPGAITPHSPLFQSA